MEINRLINIQNNISKQITLKPFKLNTKYKIAAFDISFNGNIGYGVCIILNENMELIEDKSIKQKIDFPYIPTFLAFRELPLIMKLYKRIKNEPDLILIDGNGLIHPRKCGIAVHFGVLVKKPTIGIAKSYLYGKYREPDNKKFSYSYVYHEDNSVIGAVLRSKKDSKPIFISPGNLINLKSSLDIVKKFITNYRIPQPLRLAHMRSKLINLNDKD